MSKGRPVPTLRASANIVSEWKLRQRPQSVISAKWAALWYQRRRIRVQNSSQSYFNRVYFSFYFPAVLYKILRLMLKLPASVRPMFAERLHTSLYKYSNNSHVEQGNRLWWIDVSIYLSIYWNNILPDIEALYVHCHIMSLDTDLMILSQHHYPSFLSTSPRWLSDISAQLCESNLHLGRLLTVSR